MSYEGVQSRTQEDYILNHIVPCNPEFDLEQLKTIQSKLEDFTSGKSDTGITIQEAETFLDWITYNARNYTVRNTQESIMTASMTGQCALTQRINYKLLSKIGLDVRTFNMANCIGEIPINAEDIRRINNGHISSKVQHSVSLVNLPIINNNGNTSLYPFGLDPTIRQFFLKANCQESKFSSNEYSVAPDVGYFMQAENLMKLGVSEEIAQKTEKLGKTVITKGYFYLNEENAKLYGDAFARASRRLEFQHIPIDMSGKEYLDNFENIHMDTLRVQDEEEYTKLPNEIENQRKGFFSKLIDFFKNRFGNKKTVALNQGYMSNKKGIPAAKLTQKQLAQFREGESQILDDINNPNYNTLEENNINRDII